MKYNKPHYLSIGEVANILGVSVPTLRRWDKLGKLNSSFRTFGEHRRYDIEKVKALIKKENHHKKALCYSRVSTHDQKNDLKSQSEKLKTYCKNNHIKDIELIEDIGSGLNFNKKGFKKLFSMILNNEIDMLILNHKDRLLRFGSEILFKLCEWKNIEVIILEKTNETFEKELVTSLLEIITVFSSKLYGSRSHKNKRSNQLAAQT